MEQPLPPKHVHHVGLAAAAANFREDAFGTTWAKLLSQLMYGYVLLDNSAVKSGGGWGTVTDEQGRTGVAVYTGEAALRATQGRRGSFFVTPAPTLGQVVERAGAEFAVIDPGGTAVMIPRATLEDLADQKNNPGIRAALDLGPRTRATVLDMLGRDRLDPLLMALHPDSPLVRGTGTEYQARSSVAPDGSSLLVAYTSQIEVFIRHPEDAWAARPVADIVRDAIRDYQGMILNPGTSWIILTAAELMPVAERLST